MRMSLDIDLLQFMELGWCSDTQGMCDYWSSVPLSLGGIWNIIEKDN